MPWKVTGVVEKRKEFLAEYATGEWTMTDLCRAYGSARPTGHALFFHTIGEQQHESMTHFRPAVEPQLETGCANCAETRS